MWFLINKYQTAAMFTDLTWMLWEYDRDKTKLKQFNGEANKPWLNCLDGTVNSQMITY